MEEGADPFKRICPPCQADNCQISPSLFQNEHRFKYSALRSSDLSGDLSIQFLCVSRITASTSTAFACVRSASRSMLPSPSSMLSDVRIGVMDGPVILVPRSLMWKSFIRVPRRFITSGADTPASVGRVGIKLKSNQIRISLPDQKFISSQSGFDFPKFTIVIVVGKLNAGFF